MVARLDAALTSKSVHLAVSAFMIKILEEAVSGLEFVEHEVLHHIQGSRSVASVRGIGLKAREIWERLAGQGRHWPGMIPPSELRRFNKTPHLVSRWKRATLLHRIQRCVLLGYDAPRSRY